MSGFCPGTGIALAGPKGERAAGSEIELVIGIGYYHFARLSKQQI